MFWTDYRFWLQTREITLVGVGSECPQSMQIISNWNQLQTNQLWKRVLLPLFFNEIRISNKKVRELDLITLSILHCNSSQEDFKHIGPETPTLCPIVSGMSSKNFPVMCVLHFLNDLLITHSHFQNLTPCPSFSPSSKNVLYTQCCCTVSGIFMLM